MGGGNFNVQNRGGFSGNLNEAVDCLCFCFEICSSCIVVGPQGNMNLRGGQQHGGMRPLLNQRNPMAGGNNAGGFGNMGAPRGGPSIPPFPRAWHGQDQSGPV